MIDREITWKEIVLSYRNHPRDVKTIPLYREGIWFYVYVENGDVYLENAKNHVNSSNMKVRRKLDKKKFDTMVEIYGQRLRGEKISKYSTQVTRNQVYWYGIFADMNLGKK